MTAPLPGTASITAACEKPFTGMAAAARHSCAAEQRPLLGWETPAAGFRWACENFEETASLRGGVGSNG
ncbi:MAG: hypothetical protein ACKV19_08085, partial [Verrucomicrobiales bacterium]